MSTDKVSETLDSMADKVFGFSDKTADRETHEADAPATHDGEKTETLTSSHAPTETYPVAEERTEELAADHRGAEHPAEREYADPAVATPAPATIGHESYPPRPANPPAQHHQEKAKEKEARKRDLTTGPEQDFTVATVAGFVGAFSLLMMFSKVEVGLLAIIFGATAVYFARRTERAGIAAGLAKSLGWVSFLGGILALFATIFFLAVASVVVMVR